MISVRSLPALAAVAGLLVSSSSAQGKLWTVSPNPGEADFLHPQEAVDAASDGDTIVVKAGVYAPQSMFANATISVVGKSLTFEGVNASAVEVQGSSLMFGPVLRIVQLAPDQTVTVAGMSFTKPGGFGLVGLLANQGAVRFEECRFVSSSLGAALEAAGCSSLVLTRCTLEHTLPVGNALLLRDSHASLYDCSARGGDGVFGVSVENDAGHAAVVDGGTLLIYGSVLEGGDGAPGTDTFPPCAPGGDGGHGVLLQGLAPTVYVVDSLVFGGAGDWPSGPPCAPGLDGSDFAITAGSVVPLAGVERSLRVTSPMETDGFIDLHYSGQPHDLLGVLLSLSVGQTLVPALAADLLVGAPFQAVLLGTADAGGFLHFYQSPIGAVLPPGVEALTFRAQGLALDASGTSAGLTTSADLTVVQSGLL